MLNLKPNMKEIEGIRFLNFSNIIKFDEIDDICIPQRIEHMPPDVLRHLLISERFVDNVQMYQDDETDCHHNHKKTVHDVKLLQATTTMDVYSLGVILLQIVCGCPPQLELPIKVKCTTVKDEIFVATPAFGHCPNGIVTKMHVDMTIKFQERYGKHTTTMLNKLTDYYGLLADQDFCDMFVPMISNNYEMRPTVGEILNSDFIKKWADTYEI